MPKGWRLCANPAGRARLCFLLAQWDQACARALALEPSDGELWAYRGRANARQALWEKAAGNFAKAVALRPDDAQAGFELAFLRLQLGDMAGYRRVCRDLFKHHAETNDPTRGYWVVRAATLAPEVIEEPDRLVALARQAVASEPGDSGLRQRYQRALGTACVRAGQYDEAVKQLHSVLLETPPQGNDTPVFEWLWLALAHHGAKRRNGPSSAWLLSSACSRLLRRLPRSRS